MDAYIRMNNASSIKKKRNIFTKVYTEYYPYVFNTVYSKIGNEHDAGDICQEIFLIFFEKFEMVENPRKWLFGTMKNVVLRYYERKNKSDVDIDSIFNDDGLIYLNGFRDTRLIIQEAVENSMLSDEEKMLLDYIAFNGYSYSNAGIIMGLSKKQVFLRYSRAVKIILNYLKTRGINNIEELL